MYFRVSRLRFVVVRCTSLVIFLLLLVEMRMLFKRTKLPLTRNSMELDFWRTLIAKDEPFTTDQRVKQIEWLRKQRNKHELNWTKIFRELYRRKIDKLEQRDQKNIYKSRIIDSSPNVSQNIFEIFEQTPVFQRPKFCSSSRILHPQCPFSNCRWTCQKSPINHDNLRRASVFHHVDINLEEMRDKTQSRSDHDIWILWIDEANRQLEHLNNYHFNWTLSFRQDSEISIGTYGLLVPDDKKTFTNKSDILLSPDFLYILTNRNILITDYTLENQILINYRYRSKHALWFVSNCGPQARLNYYEQLRHYFPIKAFGSCISSDDKSCQKSTPCEVDQTHLALFYLAFESQTCTDYITEKFWRALSYGMIPIVSGPSKQSYLDLGIPSSAFIHVNDFQSARQLGNYLHRIADDYFLYREYFQWRSEYYVFYHTQDLEPIRMCELCMRLNMQETNEHRFYKDIHQWHRKEC